MRSRLCFPALEITTSTSPAETSVALTPAKRACHQGSGLRQRTCLACSAAWHGPMGDPASCVQALSGGRASGAAAPLLHTTQCAVCAAPCSLPRHSRGPAISG